MESRYVRVKQMFTDYGDDCFTPGRPVLAAAEDLMHKIHRDFAYAPGATTIKTSAVEAFEARRGVCQDFAHIMIACLRSRGMAARYVSGYLRTTPRGHAATLAMVGADASHAWVSVFCPPFGWVALDPTNDMRAGRDHITVAWGRDFGDVSPLRGVHRRRRPPSLIGTRFRAGGVRSTDHDSGESKLAKPNYRHAKKQKEAARKARQDAKQQRRSSLPEAPDGRPGPRRSSPPSEPSWRSRPWAIQPAAS